MRSNTRFILTIVFSILIGIALATGFNHIAVNASDECVEPQIGDDIYLWERGFTGFRGIVLWRQYKEDYPPVIALQTYQGHTIFVECMEWRIAEGEYIEGTLEAMLPEFP